MNENPDILLLDPSEYDFTEEEWETYIKEEYEKGNPWKKQNDEEVYMDTYDWEEKFLKRHTTSTILGKRVRF